MAYKKVDPQARPKTPLRTNSLIIVGVLFTIIAGTVYYGVTYAGQTGVDTCSLFNLAAMALGMIIAMGKDFITDN